MQNISFNPFYFFIALLGFFSVEAQNKTPKIQTEYLNQVKSLIQEPKVKIAMDFIKNNDSQTLTDQIKLTEIEAPPFKEHKFGKAKLFTKLLQQYGADSVWTDGVGNVIALRKGTAGDKVLAIAGHIDTVFPEGTDVEVKLKGDTLYAPGISDDGRGLTTVLTLLRAMKESDLRTQDDILFIGDVGEEGLGDLRGMKALFGEEGPQINAFISIDGNGISRIVNGALGSHRYKVTFHGPGGHSWGAFGLANPAHALAKTIALFTKEADRYTQTGGKTSYNVGRIGGGTSVNSIPFSAWMEVDMRALEPKRLEDIDQILQKAIKKGLTAQNKLRRRGDSLTVEVEMIGNRPSGKTDPQNPLVQYAMAANQISNEKSYLTTSSTDSNIPISLGIPAITLGGGGMAGGAHSLHEWFLNTNGYKGIQRTLLLLVAQAGLD